MTPQTLKGFRDFPPKEAAARQWLRGEMIKVFERWGYEPLETPTLEPYDLFKGEVGEDEKLFYKFTDLGDREVMLRYDQTVPTCRFVGQYFTRLTFPFRRYQIQPCFRAEKPQAGRYREFVQADIDIFGVASPMADAEAIAVSLDLYKSLGFKQAIAVANNRDLMKGVPYEAIVAVDKLQKVGEQGVLENMIAKGISLQKAKEYFDFVKNIQPDETIKIIFEYLESVGFSADWYRFEPTLARAFSYSQGPIWEIVIPEYSSGSVGGGERYDGLVKRITGRDIPGTGIAFGFDRTLEAAQAANLVPSFTTPTQIMVTVFTPNLYPPALQLSCSLRNSGVNTELYPDPGVKLERQLKYAAACSIPFVAILGPEEVEKSLATVKNLQTGEQTRIKTDQLADWITDKLP